MRKQILYSEITGWLIIAMNCREVKARFTNEPRARIEATCIGGPG
jgi:hypothetical protein